MIKNEYLINLSEFTYEDYLSMDSYINESYQSKEVDRLVDKLKDLVNKAKNGDIDENTKDDIEDTMSELNKKADEISDKNKSLYKSIYVISTIVSVIETVVSICSLANTLFGKDGEPEPPVDKNGKPLVIKTKRELILYILKSTFSPIAREVKNFFKGKTITEVMIAGLKKFFTVKNILSMALSSINKFIGAKAFSALEYEKMTDKSYEILINCESKLMIEKRKAKQNKDSKTEENCDMVIAYIEKLKKNRMKEISTKNESVILEYNGNEMNINNFRQICRDLYNAIEIEKQNLNKICEFNLYTLRKALSASKDNIDSRIDLIERKQKAIDDYINDEDRLYNKKVIDAIFNKYNNLFSNKYSKYGMASREKFEKRLSDIQSEIVSIINSYSEELENIKSKYNVKGEIIDAINAKLIDDIGLDSLTKIKDVYLRSKDDLERISQFCLDYIKWCKSNLNTAKIKNSLKYKFINKIFK